MRPASLLSVALASCSFVFAQPDLSNGAPATAPAARSAEAQDPEDIELPGVVLNRPDGRFLAVETSGVSMRITFYNKDKKQEPADALRITARWTDTQPRFTVLLPESESTLVSPGVLKRPFNYIVYLAVVGKDEKVIETHSLRLK